MLRNAILAVAVLLFAGAATAVAIDPASLGFLVFATVLLLGTALERVGYGRAAATPPPGQVWQATSERFVDPETGRLVSVWFDAANGERCYVDEGQLSPRS